MLSSPRRLATLETTRLRLQPLVEDDVVDLYGVMQEPELMAGWDAVAPDDPEVAAEIIRGELAGIQTGRTMAWSVRTLAENALVGWCDLSEIERRHRRAELGFMFGKGAAAEGYGPEAVAPVVASAARAGLRRLASRTHLGARRSERLLEDLGFRQEGLLRGHVLHDGERRDCRLFGLLL